MQVASAGLFFAVCEVSFLVWGEPPSIVQQATVGDCLPQLDGCLPAQAVLGGQFRLDKVIVTHRAHQSPVRFEHLELSPVLLKDLRGVHEGHQLDYVFKAGEQLPVAVVGGRRPRTDTGSWDTCNFRRRRERHMLEKILSPRSSCWSPPPLRRRR
ncbi:unnamed protein product [Prorocentrum cordatum]|uniref:Secreted protein n=1 Tax=Prorocentrum cordatum TaxID=2364126 RepID=A0ABN9X6J0_9DINO|nr:unnamed protein product [Polarella glacialis]